MTRNYFGTNIMFAPAKRGKGRCKSYQWIASTREDMPYVTVIRKHRIWKTKNKKTFYHALLRALNHEPIHQILWKIGEDPNTNYDIVKYRFGKKMNKELKTQKERKELRECM